MDATQAMNPGDILVYWGTLPGTDKLTPSHIALACDGANILHNTIATGPGFAGVVKHKAASAAQGFLSIKDGRTKIEVFRLKDDRGVGKLASDYGEKWAAPVLIEGGKDFVKAKAHKLSDDPKFTKRDRDFKPLTKQMNPWIAREHEVDFKAFETSKSPYSTGRLELGQTSELKQWTQESAFRAVKAYVRECTQMGLSSPWCK